MSMPKPVRSGARGSSAPNRVIRAPPRGLERCAAAQTSRPPNAIFQRPPAVIVGGRPVPHLTLFKATPPAGTGGAAINIAQLRFLYDEASVDLEDERQFARNPGAGVSSLVLPAISGCSR